MCGLNCKIADPFHSDYRLHRNDFHQAMRDTIHESCLDDLLTQTTNTERP